MPAVKTKRPKANKGRPNPISEMEIRFCRFYVLGPGEPNITEAAKKAGYAPKSAHVSGSRLLKKAKVKAEIARLRYERELRTLLSSDFVIGNLMADATDRSEHTSSASRVRANELLGRHLGLFKGPVVHPVRPVVTYVYLPPNDRDDALPDAG